MLPRPTSLLLLAALPCFPALKKIHLVDRTDVPGYAYERIVAKAHFAVDPSLPANRIIRDIEFAPRNEDGLVEFSADLFVLKPRNPTEGNGTLLFEVSNRGRKGILSTFSFAPGSLDPHTKEDMGDGFLLKAGYTLVWVGWQFDVPNDSRLMRLFAPVARKDGQPIRGPVRAQWVPDRPMKEHSLGDRNTHIPYPVADPSDASIKLTVRDHLEAPTRVIPRDQWQFAREEFGKVTPDRTRVYLPAGFEPGKIYEVVYPAEDPVIAGLGPAAIRDLISFLRYENAGTILLGEQSRHLKRSLAFGTSQSGRFLRTFLYFGFNSDEKGRKVFDGVWANVAGAGRGSFNHRFAQPSRDGHPHMNVLYPTDLFPFTDRTQTDPETGITDGLLARVEQNKTTPKIFYTNGSYEYWGRGAGLIHTTVDGKSDVAPAPDTRIFLLGGTQHGPGSFPPRKTGTQHLSNPNDFRPLMRALLTAMNAWIRDGKEPPASAYPLIAKDEMVTLGALQFPRLPGVAVPKYPQRAWRPDFGPEFRASGIVTKEPPEKGKPFLALLPQTDRDGNEISGVRMPEVQAPLGTYAGWNLRSSSIGAPDQLYSMTGSFFPFAKTKAEREKNKDPRASIEERYPSRDAYLAAIREAAKKLERGGYLLSEDIGFVEKRAVQMWEALAAGK